ncbi:MAG: hypothetical protein FWE85_02195, partial [Clostridiales bacterium]|nr:hypothetical protein [Clostridiales bacterium]
LEFAGLFGTIYGGTVKNLAVKDASVTGRQFVAGLAGMVYYGGLENCSVTGAVSSGNDVVGGVAGWVDHGSLKDCYATVMVSGRDRVGGVAGSISNGCSIENCYAMGNVSGRSSVGGVVGSMSGGSIENCYATGNVTGVGRYVGGVAGALVGGGSMESCYATGNVSGGDYAGGVVGHLLGTLKNCYATGAVSGKDCVGGVAGNVYYNNSRVENCAALNSSVSGESNVGRVFGFIEDRDTAFTVSFARNNVAFFGMTVMVNGTAKTLVRGYDTTDGMDISAAQISADGTIEGRFTATGGWTVQNGKLPGIGAVVGLPAHIK